MSGGHDDDARALAGYASALADGVEQAVAGWVVAAVERGMGVGPGGLPEPVATDAAAAGEQARAEVRTRLRALLALDVDQQATTPLSIVRSAVVHPTAVLRAAGVPPRHRDAMATETFPDDDYDLVPGSLGELDPSLQELAIMWGAAKAHVVIQRHQDLR